MTGLYGIWIISQRAFIFFNRVKKKVDTEAIKKGPNQAFLNMKTTIYEMKITLDLINGW